MYTHKRGNSQNHNSTFFSVFSFLFFSLLQLPVHQVVKLVVEVDRVCRYVKHRIQVQVLSGPSEAVRHGGGRRTKNLQGEREKEEKGGKKEKRGERKERRKGKVRARRAREDDVGILHLYRCKTPT